MIKYYPYKSDKTTKKYYIITNQNKKVYFGAAGYSDFPTHKDDILYIKSMNQYINSYHNYKESKIKQYIQDLNEYIFT